MFLPSFLPKEHKMESRNRYSTVLKIKKDIKMNAEMFSLFVPVRVMADLAVVQQS